MGYEIVYHFHERLESGGYDKSETKELKKKVGDPFEDVSLEKLAGAIMGQLARRDIWVNDVEIYEYSKKKINFRETTGGIVIKNKKFSADGGVEVVACQEEQEAAPKQYPHELIKKPEPKKVMPKRSNKPIKWVIFAPSEMKTVKEKQLRFTVEKKYAVFREDFHPSGIGMMYCTVDDLGREQLISDEYFVPAEPELVAGRELGFGSVSKNDIQLNWQGVINDDVPNLR